MARVLVTGGAGFIGSTFAKHMMDKGHAVVVFDSLIRKGVEFNLARLDCAEIIRGDVRFAYDFEKIKGSFDGIFHAAANPGIKWSIEYPEFDFDTNARGTLNVLEFARKNGKIPVVYCSTNKVYDGEKINQMPLKELEYSYDYYEGGGIAEDFPVDGRDHSLYGVSKLAGDLLCQEYSKNMGVPTVVNRMSCITGPHSLGVEDQNWFAWFAFAGILKKKINIFGDGKQVRDILAGSDLARLVEIEFKNMDKLSGQVFNVGGGRDQAMSLLQCLDHLKELNFPTELNFHDWRVADQKVYISDTTKVRKHTGWAPKIPPKKLLEKILAWIIENPEIVEFYKKNII